ncbi:MAG: hypothetical protein KKE44_10765 [Proteobacteria bacterium]|nr:hypothetical protein [Pseudomonadota bacterium]MBU1583204.1 hypothetical protein [Pseudomonadota bacterium]MBU2455053.1 hypothetical protein [Pseudomonadota bacterium]MBU2627653.1 hypothetical protein [Pseudomonadota bacterium]
MKKNNCLGVIIICLFILIPFSGSHAQTVSSDEISVTIPRSVMINFIRAALPLNLENGQYLKGKIWVQTINQVNIGSNKVEFEMTIQGKNLKFATHLGKQVLLLDIGNLNAVFNCDASIRYDASKRLLYITPNIVPKPNENDTDQLAANLLQMLSLTNGTEYPVEIQKVQPFVTKIGGDTFNIDMDITHMSTEKDAVFIRGLPKFQKING